MWNGNYLSQDPENDVKIEGRFVQLELGPNDPYRESNLFQFSDWQWQLDLSRDDKGTFVVHLWVVPNLPIYDVKASISLTFFCFPKNQNKPPTVHYPPAIEEEPLWCDFTWTIGNCGVPGRCLAVISFDTIQHSGTLGTGGWLAWPIKGELSRYTQACGWSAAARMLHGGLFSDVTLHAVGGSVRAHRGMLGALSPVFFCMFSHDFREKALSAVDIPDMSIGACRAFVSYFYGEASEAELIAHRLELVAAGEKYGVDHLKWMCARSLTEDVDAGNVLERLQTAHLYQLQELKRICIRLLLEFGMMYEIPEDFDAFMRAVDKDLVAEIKKSWRHVLRSKYKSSSTTPDQDKAETSGVGDGARAKRARRPNVRLAGGEWTE